MLHRLSAPFDCPHPHQGKNLRGCTVGGNLQWNQVGSMLQAEELAWRRWGEHQMTMMTAMHMPSTQQFGEIFP